MNSSVSGKSIEFVKSIWTFLLEEMAPILISGGIGSLLFVNAETAASYASSFCFIRVAKNDPRSDELNLSSSGTESNTGSERPDEVAIVVVDSSVSIELVVGTVVSICSTKSSYISLLFESFYSV